MDDISRRRAGIAASYAHLHGTTARIGPRSNVMILEDDVDLLLSMSRALMAEGYAVTASQNAEHAMTIITAPPCRVELAIVDVILPGMDGITFMKQARIVRPNLRFLFTTGSDNSSVLAELPAGVAVLLKPFRRQEILDRVEQCMSMQWGS